MATASAHVCHHGAEQQNWPMFVITVLSSRIGAFSFSIDS
jgi:hypothetical protein